MRKARDDCLDDSYANGSDGIHDVALLHPSWQRWLATEPFATASSTSVLQRVSFDLPADLEVEDFLR
jgi:hypothetical protein